VNDTENPTITCTTVTLNSLTAPRDPYATGYPTLSDNCSDYATLTNNLTFTDDLSGLTGPNVTGTILRQWTVYDDSNNTNTCTQTITINDTVGPVISGYANLTTNAASGLCAQNVIYPVITSADAGHFEGFEPAGWFAGDYFDDDAQTGNPSTSWNNNNSRILRATGPLTPSTGAAYGVINSTQTPPSPFYDYTGAFSRLGGFDDTFGQGFRVAQDVYVDLTDTNVVNATATTGYGWSVSAAASDQNADFLKDFVFHTAAYDSTGVWVAADGLFGFFRRNDLTTLGNNYQITTSGWYTFEWVFQDDGSGNLEVLMNLRSTGSSTILFSETIATTESLATSVGGHNYLWFTFVDTDYLPIDNTVLERFTTVSPDIASGSSFNVGTTPVTLTSSDIIPNATVNTFTVTVVDDQPPVASCQDKTLTLDGSGWATLVIGDINNGSSDNCTITNLELSKDGSTGWASSLSYDCTEVGTHTVTLRVTDSAGLTDTCTATVTVEDNTPPAIVCNNISITLDGTGNYTLSPADQLSLVASATDNCSIASTNLSQVSFNFCNSPGSVPVTVTVTDVNGNEASCVANVTVNPPVGAPLVVYVDDNYPATCAAVSFPSNGVAGPYYVGFNAFQTIQAAVNAVGVNGFVNVAAGVYDERVVVSKAGVTVQGAGTGSVVTGTGTAPGGGVTPSVFKVAATGVTVSDFQILVNFTNNHSGVHSSGTCTGLTVSGNTIVASGATPAFSYGLRNAIAVNPSITVTGYSPDTSGYAGVLVSGNTITNDSTTAFRAGIQMDLCGGTITGNTSLTINHDFISRFANQGDITVSGNTFLGGGAQVGSFNPGAGTITITNNLFDNSVMQPASGSLGTGASLRLIYFAEVATVNNNVVVVDNTFQNHRWGVSVEDFKNVTFDNNTFTPKAGTTDYVHMSFNTKIVASTSASPTLNMFAVGATLINNVFNDSGSAGGIGLAFYNHRSTGAVFGTHTLGTPGNENDFAAGIGTFIELDASAGASSGWTRFGGYGSTPVTTMAPWGINLDAQNNRFDVGSGLALPTSMPLPDLFATEDKIQHATDIAGLGLVRVNDDNVYVTTASGSIQRGIDAATAGDTVNVSSGTFVTPAQLVIGKSLTLAGAGETQTILNPGVNTTVGGNVQSEAWVYVAPSVTVGISGFTLDGAGKSVNHAIQSRGDLNIEGCTIKNVRYGTYNGRGIVLYSGSSVVRDCTFLNIERIGVHVRGNVMSPNPIALIDKCDYTGKGAGDWLDYAFEIGGGGQATITACEARDCLGVATTDGSTSAGVLATDYWGTGTQGSVQNCKISNSSAAIAVGYSATDATTLAAIDNSFETCGTGIVNAGVGAVTAVNNWWGDQSGPTSATLNPYGTGSEIDGTITFSPWLASGTDTSVAIGFQPAPGVNYIPTQLAFATQPIGAALGSPLATQPIVKVVDAFNTVTPWAQTNVTLVIGNNPGGGTLTGTIPQFSTAGVASFTDLAITVGGGVDYTLVASAPGLTSATSAGFDIINPAPSITSLNPAGAVTGSGGGSASVVITGANFVPMSVVLVNDSPVSKTFDSATQLTATLSTATAGSYSVVVSNPAVATTSGVLTFTVGGTPNVVFVDDNYGPGNSGTNSWGYDAFATIQGGVNAVASGGTVNVAAGTYAENVNIATSLSLLGADAGTACGGTGQSIINGGLGTAVTIAAPSVTLDGFALTGLYGVSNSVHSGAVVRNNQVNAGAVGIQMTFIAGALTIQSNCVTLATNQIVTPTLTNGTVAVLLGSLSGSGQVVQGNNVAGAQYGYLLADVDAATPLAIVGGAATGVMQGVAVLNYDVLGNQKNSTFTVDGVSMSAFAGTTLDPNRNFHAGVYVFTGGADTSATVVGTVTNVTILGTGKPQQDSAGVSVADFSTGAGARQTITVLDSVISTNANRGVQVRGSNAVASVTGCTLIGNGFDPFGDGGNDGFGVIARNGAQLTVEECSIVNPSSVTGGYTVTALAAHEGAQVTAFNNSVLNPFGLLAGHDGGSSLLNASGNWWGNNSEGTFASGIAAPVDFTPYLDDGTDTGSAAGFQGDFSTLHVTLAGAQTGSTGRIQEGIDLTTASTVLIGGGIYNEWVDVNKYVQLIGTGSGTGNTVLRKGAGGSSQRGIVQLSASGTSGSPILIKDLRIEPVGIAGISVGLFTQATGVTVDYVTLDNVHVVGSNTSPCTEQERGLYVDLTSSLLHLTVADCAFDNLHYGWYIQKQVSADASTVQYVSVSGTSFTHNNTKGIYAEKMSDATFTCSTVSHNGYDWTLFTGCIGSGFTNWMSGIDVNLKAGNYANLTFQDCNFTQNGTGGAANGVALALKGRGTGSDSGYAAFPANLSNVQVLGCLFSGNERSIQLGEPGKGNTTPTAVVIANSSLAPTVTGIALRNEMAASVAVTATNVWWGDATGPAVASNAGGSGEQITGATLVDYSPWLGALNNLASSCGGLQPDPGTPIYYVPAGLSFTTEPGNALINAALAPQPVVTVTNEIGLVATQFVGSVSLTIANNPGGGALSGTASLNAVGGVATFAGLSIDQAGTGYTLTASAAAPITPVTSAGFTISNPGPTVASMSPTEICEGSGGFSLTVNGTGFVSGESEIQWNGNPRTTTFVNSGQLTATISAADVAVAGAASVTVVTPGPGGGTAGPLTFTIKPLPAITDATVTATVGSPTGSVWSVSGIYPSYSMCIDPLETNDYYLDIDTLTSGVALQPGALNAFTLDQTSLPANWLPYWAAKGVVSGATGWQGQMWQIINGNAPFFYIKYTGTDYLLVDALQYALFGGEPILRVPGDYPQHNYKYSGAVAGVNSCASLAFNVFFNFNTMPVVSSATVQATEGAGGPAWPVSSSYPSFSMCIDPLATNSYFLDIDTFASGVPLQPGVLNAFSLDQTSLPANWLSYWAARGVVSGATGWQGQMWQIINGNAPFFYIKLSGPDYLLVDALQYWAAGNTGEPVLRVPGDYPQHNYKYSGTVQGTNLCDSSSFSVFFNFNTMPVVASATVQATVGSPTGPAWPVSSSYPSFSMCIDPLVTSNYFLDLDTFTSGVPLEPGVLNAFTLDQTSLPANWLSYWAARGVVSGATGWQGQMWQIINGNAPFFYIKLSGSDYLLVDALQYWAAGNTGEPVLRVPGDYPQHNYQYTGTVQGTNYCVSSFFDVFFNFNTVPVPTITGADPVCPDSVQVYSTESGMTGYTWSVTGGTGSSTSDSITVTWGPAGPGTVSVNYDNAAGCTAAAATVKNVTIGEGVPPTITCPANVTTNVIAGCDQIVVWDPPVASDNCTVTNVTCVPPSGSSFAVGTHTVLCYALDSSGNSNYCTFTVTVNDTIPPVVTPGTIASCYTDQTAAQAAAIAATSATDNCGVASTNILSTTGDCSATITVRVTDIHGNYADVAYNTRIDNVAPTITATTATQGVASVVNCATTAQVGTVILTVTASDKCGLSGPPSVVLTNGPATTNATFVIESPTGTYNYTWEVTTSTANGTWGVTVTASDLCQTDVTNFNICVNKTQVSGLVQLEGFTGEAVGHSRVVTFVATTNWMVGTNIQSTVLKTWNLTLTNESGDTFSYQLTGVPVDANGLSAKTAWNLREKLALTFDGNGQAAADFVSDGTGGWSDATDHYLRGADIVQAPAGQYGTFNIVNVDDYSLLGTYWTLANTTADVTGDGYVNVVDYSILAFNFYDVGDDE
jgi:hypothetical protein